MDDHKDLIASYVDDMITQCDSFRQTIPRDNAQARMIVANFYEQFVTLQNMLDINDSKIECRDNPFTKREFEILEHVSNGYTNKEIASALSVSHKTIEFHLNSILRKTDSSTRTEAIKISIKSGWIKL